MIQTTDVVIVGAGPVGLFTIFECGMVGLKVHVFDPLPHVGGQCAALYPEKPIYDIPSHPVISGFDLIENLKKQAEPFNPIFHLEDKVTDIESLENGEFLIKSAKGAIVQTKALIIAAGAGAFGPNRPPLENLELYEGKSVLYFVPSQSLFKDKKVVIAGGGDSAVDWAIILSDIAQHVTVIHRRQKFKAAPENESKLISLVESGKITLEVPYQLHSLKGNTLEKVVIQHIEDGSLKSIDADYLLPFFGLAMNLGPIADWGLGLHKKHIETNPLTGETNRTGIYAVGDVATYPHKLKLILTGFAEAAQTAYAIRRQIHPDEVFHFEYSTTKGVKS